MKKRVSAVLTAATAVGAVWAVPTVAHAADPYPDLNVSSWQERIVVTTSGWEEHVPKGLKGYVHKKGASTPISTLTQFTFMPEDCTNRDCGSEVSTSYFQSEQVKLPELGEYAIDIEYTGTEGEKVVRKDIGTLAYKVRPVFSNLKPSAITLARLETVISGDLALYNPLSGASEPYAGAAFTTSRGTVTTPQSADAKGHFDAKFPIAGVDFAGDPNYNQVQVGLRADVAGTSGSAQVLVPVAPVEAVLKLDSPTVTGAYNTAGRIGGTATWKAADGTWKPVPAKMPVRAAGWETGLTDAAGRFTLTGQLRADAIRDVEIDSRWVKGKTRLKVDTTAGTAFSGFHAWVSPLKTVVVSGWFERGEIPAGTTSLPVDVEYSADGKTGWTSRKRIDVPTTAGTNTRATINHTLPYPGPGYVRLRYAGTPAIHGSVTPAVRIERTMTAIPEFNATPEPAKKGKPITLTGKLNHRSPDWKPFAGQRVDYYFRPAGSTTWTAMGFSMAGADGSFTKSFTAARTGSWQARYVYTDETHFVATGREDEVVVTP